MVNYKLFGWIHFLLSVVAFFVGVDKAASFSLSIISVICFATADILKAIKEKNKNDPTD